MYFLYSLGLICYGLALLPVALLQLFRGRKAVPNPRHSLGLLPPGLQSDGRPTLWFHSCSLGETLSVGPLAHGLHQRFPGHRLVFSTITQTGQAIARKRFQVYGEDHSFYLPFDIPPVVRRVFDRIRPSMLIIIDVEIWPNLVREARRRGIPVVLCNGRISAEAFRFYRLARPFLKQVLGGYRLLMMKSEEDAERIRRMGAPPGKVMVTGNIKCDRDVVEQELRRIQIRDMVEALGAKCLEEPLIVAGSTHHPEEALLLEVLGLLQRRAGLGSLRLLLAPRHPERFDEVAELARRQGFRVRRRSAAGPPEAAAEVLLLDSVGELPAAYQFATVAVVGGTFIRHGGQSILEPAFYAKPIVIGPSMENFPQIIDEFRAHRAVLQIAPARGRTRITAELLAEVLGGLLENPAARETLGLAAAAVLERSRGASALTVARLTEVLGEKAPMALG